VSAHMATRLLAFVAWLLLACGAQAADVPYLTGRVVDEAGILSPGARERLAATSKAHEEKTSNQVIVLTLPTLDGESIEDYATRAFAAWKLGQAGKDNGVLVIVVPNDRRMRIEVGYGLEGTLPDVVAARIIREQMTPRFKAGDYDGGVLDGVNAIVARLEGRASTSADVQAPAVRSDAASVFDSEEIRRLDSDLPPWPMRILIGAFVFGIIGLFTFLGIVTPGSGWFLYVFLIPFWAMFPIVIVGVKGALVLLTIYIVAFPIAKVALRNRPWYQKASKQLRTTGQATIGGVVIGGGGSSSGGGGGGGVSGGGGSSGGGGASGSW
jgi:uncharacterized protein